MDAIEQLKTLRLSEHSKRGYGYPEAQIYHGKNEVALDMAIEALEKQTGLEPIDTWDDGMVCQFCGGFVTCQRWRNGKPYCEELKYCPNCGHKVNWQEV